MPVYEASPSPLSYQPNDLGFLAWCCDPANMNSTNALTVNGFLYLQRLKLRSAARVTNVHYVVSTGGTGLVAGQNFVGLYDANGNLIGQSADQSGNFAAVGAYKIPLVGGPFDVPAGDIYTAMFANHSAGTFPAFRTPGTPTSILANINGFMRFATANVGLTTTMPATFGTLSVSTQNPWTAVS